MALFEKKFCDICGEKVNLLTRLKLNDGFLCSDCKKKLSCFSSEWGQKSVEDAKKHIAEREENKAKYSQFTMSAKAGANGELVVDSAHRWFYIAYGRDYSEGNPMVFDFNALVDFYISEDFATPTDSDNDGIPDNVDRVDDRNGQINYSAGSNMNMNSSVNASGMAAAYLRRDSSAFDLHGFPKEVRNIYAVLTVRHPCITEIKIDVSGTGFDPAAIASFGYPSAMQIMQLCEQIRAAANGQGSQQGFNGQQQGFNGQQQGFNGQQQGFNGQQQGFNGQQQGFNGQQQGFGAQQQPAAAVPAVMPFCPNCGAPNTSNSAFCPNCGSSLKK